MCSYPCPPLESPLRRFITLQEDALLLLGARRVPAALGSKPNDYTAISVCTSVGFRSLEVSTFVEAARKLRPDIIVAPVDVDFGQTPPGRRRTEKMSERSTAWVKALHSGIAQAALGGLRSSIWTPIIPIDAELQKTYLDYLEEAAPNLGGVVLYSDSSAQDIPSSLRNLPCLSLAQSSTPHQVLNSVSLGIDLFALPFITQASDSGIAFTFRNPPEPHGNEGGLPLGIDLWSTAHAKDLSPLNADCKCYSCKNHHRAYIHHLLTAKEMLAWVLLQAHNHQVMDSFFENIREQVGKRTFEETAQIFQLRYEAEFPEFEGQGPRYEVSRIGKMLCSR